jgi:hypothetical protein
VVALVVVLNATCYSGVSVIFALLILAPTPFLAWSQLQFLPKNEAAQLRASGGRKVVRGFEGGHWQ